jgi:hypothetical protein
MLLSELKQYALNIATNNLLIGHTPSNKRFSTYTAEDVLTDIKDMTGNILMLELPEFNIKDELSDNVRNVTTGAILLLKKAQQGNYIEVQSAYDTTLPIAVQALSKMQNDRKKANQPGAVSPESKMKHLDLNTVNIVDVGPVFDGWYGWRINFQFNSPINLTLDESQWKPGTEIKWTF